MFGLGGGEIVIILILALVLLGPQRLPDAAKTLGKAMRDFQKATADVKQQFEAAVYEEEHPKPVLAPPPVAAAAAASVPPGGVPVTREAPPATADNVPGLEAALAEPAPRPAVAPGRVDPAPAGDVAAKA